MTREINDKVKHYPQGKNWRVIDTIGVPHMFCITANHVSYASNKYGGILGKDCIEELERVKGKGSCGHPRCNLMYNEHKSALLLEVDKSEPLNDNFDLNTYLKSIVKQCEEDGYVGFSFIEGK